MPYVAPGAGGAALFKFTVIELKITGLLPWVVAQISFEALFVRLVVSIPAALKLPDPMVAVTAADSPIFTRIAAGEPVYVPLTVTVPEIVAPCAGEIIWMTTGVGVGLGEAGEMGAPLGVGVLEGPGVAVGTVEGVFEAVGL